MRDNEVTMEQDEFRMFDHAPQEATEPRGWSLMVIIPLGWLCVALTAAPAVYLTSPYPSAGLVQGFQRSMTFALLNYLPWALATPALIALCRRLPLGLDRNAASAGILAACGLIITPLLTATGNILGRAGLLAAGQLSRDQAVANLPTAILIATLFAMPLYVGVIGIGQAIVNVERRRSRERRLLEAREVALRAQLNPHFLFNALNAIAALGHEDPMQADRALTQLAQLLRRTLDAPPTTALQQEISVVSDLVDLHRTLLGNRVVLELAMAPEVARAAVPALILQPLIENALVHGVARCVEGGVIRLCCEGKDGSLHISLTNPIPATPAEPGSGLGLGIVRGRLSAVYGKAGQLSFRQESREAVVTIRMPLRVIEPDA